MLRTKMQINIPVTITVLHDNQKLQIVDVESVLLNEISTKDESGVIQNPTKLGYTAWRQLTHTLNEALELLNSCHYRAVSEEDHPDIMVSNGVPVEVPQAPNGPDHSAYRFRPPRRHSTDKCW